MTGVLPIVHRAPTSAVAAARLIASGARMFEVDVQLRGGELVSSHYLPLPGLVGSIPVEHDNWRLRRAPGDDPTLLQVLARIPARFDVLLDPKHHRGMSAEDLRDALAHHVESDSRPERFVVSTGDPWLLRTYRAAGLRTWRSIGDRAQLTDALEAGRLPEEGVSIRHTLLDAETISALNAVTGIIAAWTVNGVDRALRLADSGVQAITTDRAAVVDALRKRAE